jgi:hypothetical protein
MVFSKRPLSSLERGKGIYKSHTKMEIDYGDFS